MDKRDLGQHLDNHIGEFLFEAPIVRNLPSEDLYKLAKKINDTIWEAVEEREDVSDTTDSFLSSDHTFLTYLNADRYLGDNLHRVMVVHHADWRVINGKKKLVLYYRYQGHVKLVSAVDPYVLEDNLLPVVREILGDLEASNLECWKDLELRVFVRDKIPFRGGSTKGIRFANKFTRISSLRIPMK